MAKKKEDSPVRQYCYWDEKLPTIQGILKFDDKTKGLRKGQTFQVQCDKTAGFTLNVRCKAGINLFFIKVTELHFDDNTVLNQIKEKRSELIERKLIEPIKGFDE